MRHYRLTRPFLVLPLVVGALLAMPARAQVATLLEQSFPSEYANANYRDAAVQIKTTDWWRMNAAIVQDPGEDNSTNYVARYRSGASYYRYICSAPTNGTFGVLSFRLYVEGDSSTTPPEISVALTSTYDYRYSTGWPNIAGVDEICTLDVDMAKVNQWVPYSITINRDIPASAQRRILIGQMVKQTGAVFYVDDIVLKEAVATLSVEDDLYATANSVVADPAAATTAVTAGGFVAPHISFTRYLEPTVTNVVLRYRTMPGGFWLERSFTTATTNETTGVITYALQGNSLSVGNASGSQLQMYAKATYTNAGGSQTVALANDEDNPLRIDILPKSLQNAAHTNLVVAGAMEAPMDTTTNGVWVGVYERAGGVDTSADAWWFDFGPDVPATSRTYGGTNAIPFKNETVRNGKTFPAPTALVRDVVFRFEDANGNIGLGSAFSGDVQTFENWAATQANGWGVSNVTGNAAVSTDATLAHGGSASLFLDAGDSLVLDKSALVGVKEVGFWMRRAGTGNAAASVSLSRHRTGASGNESLNNSMAALPTDRYVFRSFSISPEQDPMSTDTIVLTATTPLYLDDVFVADCPTASLASIEIDPEPPLHLYNDVSVILAYSLVGGATLGSGANAVTVSWGQGDNVACMTNATYAVAAGDGATWIAHLPRIERGDKDLYFCATAEAFDFGGEPIGTVVSGTNCVPVVSSSSYGAISVMRSVGGGNYANAGAMRLATDGLWKGALAAPASAQANVAYQFEVDSGTRYGGEEGAKLPIGGELMENGSVSADSVSTALTFEFDENEWTYNVREAKYAPLNGSALPSGWTPSSGVTHTSTGSVFTAGATLTVTGCSGVGQVFFWARRTTGTAATYTVKYSTATSGNDWKTTGVVGASGAIAGENFRYYVATVGNNEAKRIQITVSGAPALLQDVVVTASGAYVDITSPQISIDDGASFSPSSTTAGPTVAYGSAPTIRVNVASQGGARDIETYVEAVSIDDAGVPLDGAETALIPMTRIDNGNDTFTFVTNMPAFPAGRTGYRFVATYQGIDATQTTYPVSGYYVYETDSDLETARTPDFTTLNHTPSTVFTGTIQTYWRATSVYLDNGSRTTIAFNPESGTTGSASILASRYSFNGIGRIYFKARKNDERYASHFLAVEVSLDNGSTWEWHNAVEVPYGEDERSYTQFCIEVNTYEPARIRFWRETPAVASDACRIYMKDLVVTPPSANIDLAMPSIIHPGYPSRNDPITFRVDVTSRYADYAAVGFKPLLKWRHFTGSVADNGGVWNETAMMNTTDAAYECTLSPMAPGRVQYYVETHFSGAAYDYTTSDKYDPTLPLQFYFVDEPDMYDTDPKNFKEGSNPSYLFPEEKTPTEFSIKCQQRALYAPGTVEGDSVTPWFWFKVRAFESHHRHLEFVYTNALEVAEVGDEGAVPSAPTVYTNAMQLVGDETWLTTIPLTNSVDFLGFIYGVEPYEGTEMTEYGTTATRWGDFRQATVNPPLASTADFSSTRIRADLGTTEPVLMMVRFNTQSRAYQIRRAAYQDFNEWTADPTYFEDSVGLYDTMTYELDFDSSPLFPETEPDTKIMDFSADDGGTASSTADSEEERDIYYTSYGWRLRNGWILREREPDAKNAKSPNISAMIEPHSGYLENTDGDSALPEGLDTIGLRYRASIGGIGHLPFYKGGFDWQDYTLLLNNVRVTQMSPARPYIQVVAAYADEDNYVAMRLTQMRELDHATVRSWVKQELVRVVDGKESIVAGRSFKNFANPSGSNVWSNRFNNVELTGGIWHLSLSVTNNVIDGRAFPTWVKWDSNKYATNGLFAANSVIGESANGGTITFDAYDAVAEFGGVSVRRGNANETITASKWNLGGIQEGGTLTRWEVTGSNALRNRIPTLPFTIDVCKAGESASFPSTGTYTNVWSGSASTLSYSTVTQPVHYWGHTFLRIVPGRSDARLVVDDVQTSSWHGKDLPADPDTHNNLYWQARQAVVVNRDNTKQLALTTSRANPADRQMVSTPEMLQGIGTISFNYEVEGGQITFVVERNTVSGAYSEDAGYSLLEGDGPVTVAAGAKGEIFRAIREDMTGKVRVRILPEQSDPDATLYIDNLFAKSFPPDDGRSWTVYNTLVVAPGRNTTTDDKQFEDETVTQSAFLNNDIAADTRPNNPLPEHSPYVQSPIINTGVGEIGFWYRVWNPNLKDAENNVIPGRLTLWVAKDTDSAEPDWQQITVADLARPDDDDPVKLAEWEAQTNQFASLSCITNSSYRYFIAEICNDTNYVLRICADTNGAQRVAIDNILVTEPVRASIDVLHVNPFSNGDYPDIPLVNEPVGFEVQLGNPRMNPTDIRVFADYYLSTNIWGVANWASHPSDTIELEEDPDTQYLYRSPPDKMIPGLPVDSVVQYRIRVTYTGTFASPVIDVSFTNPSWYEPVDLNSDEYYGALGFSPYYFVFSCPTGVVFINEFYPSFNAANNRKEFVELLGPANLSLEKWKLDIVEGQDSEFEDAINVTHTFPAEAHFSDPEGSSTGWGFFLVGDDFTNIVDYVWSNPAEANLPPTASGRGGGIRLRRSMGAYVDRVSYGGGNNGIPANAMVDRGYNYAGSRVQSAAFATRSYSLDTTAGAEGDEFSWSYNKATTTLGAMNTPEAAILWDDCPFTVSGEFAKATAEALSAYFDRNAPADFLIRLTVEGLDEPLTALSSVTIDEKESLPIGSGYTFGNDPEVTGSYRVTLRANALDALDLSTNETHTVTLTIAEGLASSVTLVVTNSASASGGRSICIRPTIRDFQINDNGTATLTVTFTNEDDAETTADGWKWAIVSYANLTDLAGRVNATTNGWTAISDKDIGADVPSAPIALPASDARFYKVVTSDEVKD